MISRPTLAALATLALAPPGAARAATSYALEAGHDYALTVWARGDDVVDLLDPGGAVVASVAANGDLAHGQEFRARYSATYFIRDHDATAQATWDVSPDCRGDAQTLCTIAPGHTKGGSLPWAYDQDWRVTKLAGGHAYRIEVSGDPSVYGEVVDAKGNRLSALAEEGSPARFKPTASGVFYLLVTTANIDEGAFYKVTVWSQ